MIMTKEIAEAILEEDDEGFTCVKDTTIYDKRRWHTYYTTVYRHDATNTYWDIQWRRGSTECQDEGVEDVTFYKVKPVTKTVVEYEHD